MSGKDEKATCHGQKFGHNFVNAGSKCTRCGVNQGEISEGLEKIEYFVRKPERGMHSEAHALAKEISEYCGEPKKFGMYLGVIKHMGLSRTYQIFAEMKQGKNIQTPGKLFLYLSSNARLKKPEINKKPLRKSGAEETNKKRLPNRNKKVSSRKKRNSDYAIS